MPVLSTRCPKCGTPIRRAVDESGEYDLKCPDCGHIFVAATEDEGTERDDRPARGRRRAEDGADHPGRYRPKGAGNSNTPIVVGAVAGVLVLVGAIVGLALVFGGKDNKPVAQNNEPPPAEKARPNPPPKPNPNPPKKESGPESKTDPIWPNPVTPAPVVPARPPAGAPATLPDELPEEPVIVPPRPGPDDDPFAKAAAFKPDGPLPELPLPPADLRPFLALETGAHTAFPKFVFFTPNTDRVISVGEDKTVRAWDVASGEPVYTVHLPTGPDPEGTPYAAALSPDGKRLAVGGIPPGQGKYAPVYLLAADTGELVEAVPGVIDRVRALDFSPDGNLLAAGSMVGTLQVYDFQRKKWVYLSLALGPGALRAVLAQGRHAGHPRPRQGIESLGGRPTRRNPWRGWT